MVSHWYVSYNLNTTLNCRTTCQHGGNSSQAAALPMYGPPASHHLSLCCLKRCFIKVWRPQHGGSPQCSEPLHAPLHAWASCSHSVGKGMSIRHRMLAVGFLDSPGRHCTQSIMHHASSKSSEVLGSPKKSAEVLGSPSFLVECYLTPAKILLKT